MKLEELNFVQRWQLNGYVALYLWNFSRLVLIGCAIFLATVTYPITLFRDQLGTPVTVVLCIATYFLCAAKIGLWIINPICGLLTLGKASRTYGPKTRIKILEWVIDQHGKEAKESLDIEALARSCGELRNSR